LVLYVAVDFSASSKLSGIFSYLLEAELNPEKESASKILLWKRIGEEDQGKGYDEDLHGAKTGPTPSPNNQNSPCSGRSLISRRSPSVLHQPKASNNIGTSCPWCSPDI